MKLSILVTTLTLCLPGCTERSPIKNSVDTAAFSVAATGMDVIVDEYLFLELSMGLHDAAQVDAYIGPKSYQQQAEQGGLSMEEISQRAALLIESINSLPEARGGLMQRLRVKNLLLRLLALQTRIEINQGVEIEFDEESLRLFDAVAPYHDATYFDGILAQIDALLPGDAPLPERVNKFREQFIIPPERLALVFETALGECRRRTLQHIELPEHESFYIEYVTDQPWGGYNWYQGNARSLIQVNTDLPKYIDDAVSLGCHEAYPGHHTYNVIVEQNLVLGRGWLEFSLYPLYGPQSLIAEGSANYGIEMAFPGDERVRYEREVLFPLAGLDESNAELYYRLQELRSKLTFARNEAARDYLNGSIDAAEAQQWLVTYTLSTPERAAKSVSFIDTYRSYVINYNYGKQMVAAYMEVEDQTIEARWQRYVRLLSLPLSPSDIRVQ